MSNNSNKISQFWQELKRRKVVRVITVYAAAAFVILELVDIITEPFGLPDWTLKLVVAVLSAGLLVSIVLSWIFDISPGGGLEKTPPAHKVRKEDLPVTSISWRITSYVSFVVIIALIVLNILTTSSKSKEISNLDKSIAVLAFSNLSNDPDQEYYSEGFSDEILNSLVNVEGLKVAGRTSSFSFKDKDADIRTIGEKLGVSMVLDGSVRRSENRLRITAQLISVADGFNIWSEQYDRELKDIFDIQEEIATNIVNMLKLTVLRPKGPKQPTNSIEAHNLYLQGRHFWHQKGRVDLDKSIEYYKRALEIDPNYALAYAGMASTYMSYAWYGYLPRRKVIPQAKTAAIKALKIDNTLGEAHTELAWARMLYDWNWSESEMGYKRALDLNPNYARAHNQYAWLLTLVGRFDEAIEESKLAHELDPLSVEIWVELGRRYYFKREYNKAIEEYRKVLELFPSIKYSSVYWYVQSEYALTLLQQGFHNEAIEEYLKIDFLPADHWRLGYIYGAAGQKEKALEIVDYYLDLSEESEFLWSANIGYIYAGLGEKDKAFEWLERSYEERDSWLIQLKVDPMFDRLRSDPRFQDLLERMNFPEN